MYRHCAVIQWANGDYEGCSRTGFTIVSAKDKIKAYANEKDSFIRKTGLGVPGFKLLTKKEYLSLPAKVKDEIKLHWSIDIAENG